MAEGEGGAPDPARPALLDVNVVIALLDPSHVHHDAAHAWFGEVQGVGGSWATCPIVQNGVVRVLSNPAYVGRRVPVRDAVATVRALTGLPGHEFWPGSISLLDPVRIRAHELAGHQQVTDAFLLALAVEHNGTLVSFDRGLPLAAVVGGEAPHVTLLGG